MDEIPIEKNSGEGGTAGGDEDQVSFLLTTGEYQVGFVVVELLNLP